MYKEGDAYPDIHYTFVNTSEDDVVHMEPSGVYRLPGNLGDWVLHPERKGFRRYSKIVHPGDNVQRMFQGSVSPVIRDPVRLADIRTREGIQSSQEELFQSHPGIYYNFVCRSVVELDKELANIVRTHFPDTTIFHEKTMNSIPVVETWLASLHTKTLTPDQRNASQRIRDLLRPVLAKRNGRSTLVDKYVNEVYVTDNTKLLEDLPDEMLSTKDRYHQSTVLHAAAEAGRLEAVQYLLGRGANSNSQNGDGETPLMLACSKSHVAVALALLDAGCDTNIVDNDGQTALHACVDDSVLLPVLQRILTTVRDVNRQDDDGNSPLHIAAESNEVESVERLLQMGAKVNLQNGEGNTPLMVACSEGHQDVVEVLLRAGSETSLRNKDGATALHIAVSENEPELVGTLVQHGADGNLRNEEGRTPLELAFKSARYEIAILLIPNDTKRTKRDWEKLLQFAKLMKRKELEVAVHAKLDSFRGGTYKRRRTQRKRCTRRNKQ